MSGNICRCSAYPNIIKAISQVLESQVPESSTQTADNTVQNSSVTGIWSPPPSEAQLGKTSANNKTVNATTGGRS